MEKPRIIVSLLMVAVIGSLIFLVKEKNQENEPEVVIPVKVQRISAEPPVQILTIAGTTRSAETAVLRFQVSGRVINKTVSLGSTVKQGDVLATIYNPELEPIAQRANDDLARAQSEAEQAQREFDRIAILLKQQAVTLQEWERARTRLDASIKSVAAAKAESNRARQVSGELQLIAPFDGRITDVLIEVGDVVSAGAAVMRVSNPTAVELILPVSDKVIRQVVLGQTVRVTSALNPNAPSLNGVIIERSPFREQGSLPEIKIALAADDIGPGVAITAQLLIARESGVSLPLRSVLMTGQDTVAVYKMVDGKAKSVPIRPLSISTESVVVEASINAGDLVITEGIAQLYDGVKVVAVSTDEITNPVEITTESVTQFDLSTDKTVRPIKATSEAE